MVRRRILSVGKTQYCVRAGVSRLDTDRREASSGKCVFSSGGGGALAAVAFSKLGLDSVLCSKIGSDLNGGLIRQSLTDLGVDVRFLLSDTRRRTGARIIIADNDGNEEQTVFEGAGAALVRDDIEDAFTCYPDAVYIRADMSEELIGDVLGFAQEQGAAIYFDGRGCKKFEFCKEEMPLLEMLILDQDDVFAYCGIEPDDMQSCFDAVIKLSVDMRVRNVVLSLGERGCVLYDGKYMEVAASLRDPFDVADASTVRAAFSGALISLHMSGADAKRILRGAEAAVALVAAGDRQIDSLPSSSEISAFLLERQETEE